MNRVPILSMVSMVALVCISIVALQPFAHSVEQQFVDAELVETLSSDSLGVDATEFHSELHSLDDFTVEGAFASHHSISETEFLQLQEEARAYIAQSPAPYQPSATGGRATAPTSFHTGPAATIKTVIPSIKIDITMKGPATKYGGATSGVPLSFDRGSRVGYDYSKVIAKGSNGLVLKMPTAGDYKNMDDFSKAMNLKPKWNLYGKSKGYGVTYEIYKQNFKSVSLLNQRYATQLVKSPFTAQGPFAIVPAKEFKKTHRNSKNPRGIKSKNGVYKRKALTAAQKKLRAPAVRAPVIPTVHGSKKRKSAKKKKSVKLPKLGTSKKVAAARGGQSLIELGDPTQYGGGGKTVGGGGDKGWKSGKIGGNGQGVEKSGKIGGTGGEGVDKSGKIGGTGGGDVDKSGKIGGGSAAAGAAGAPFKPLTSKDIEKSMVSAGVDPHAYLMATGVLEEYMSYDKGVLEQGECGSCWAQTATNSLFYMHYKYFPHERVNKPSVQQILDCVKTELSNGCNGGTPMDALDWMAKNNFADLYTYPLRADSKIGECRTFPEPISDDYRSFGWSHAVPPCTQNDCPRQQFHEMELLRIVHEDNLFPIIYVHSANFQQYSDGIFPVNLCSSTLEAGDHVMELISYGTEERTGVPYWIVRNSWGEDWGIKGFMKLPFGVNACGLANYAVLATPKPNAIQQSALEQPIIMPNGDKYHADGRPWDPKSGLPTLPRLVPEPINPHSRAAFN